ncbi:Dihydroneopterin aldolase [Vigna angularis]|uniref:7,8-dihydroneopterin aldolase n=1 Tax=Phaseolus angularis TaxID=3914 RepID=A0A8T0JZ27_PHAAN|nr:Dihydroneopterin aldolase [Vigna angularis]
MTNCGFITYLFLLRDYILDSNVHGVHVYDTEQVNVLCFHLDYQLKHFLLSNSMYMFYTLVLLLLWFTTTLTFHGFHGAKPEERKLGHKFVVDIDAWMDLATAGKIGHLSNTVSYTTIYNIVKEVLEGSPHNLLESVAQKIAITTLTNHKETFVVRVKVEKPHVAVQGPVDYLGIEIHKRRSNLPG